MAGRGKRGSNISFIKPPEPSFLKRLKEQVGFQEGPTIDTKRESRREIDEDDDGRINFDDEKPVVVQLRPGDLSQEEAERILDAVDDSDNDEEEERLDLTDAKITFKKPEKRSSPDGAHTGGESSKRLRTSASRNSGSKKRSSDSVTIKNKGLLSFDDEEHDDD